MPPITNRNPFRAKFLQKFRPANRGSGFNDRAPNHPIPEILRVHLTQLWPSAYTDQPRKLGKITILLNEIQTESATITLFADWRSFHSEYAGYVDLRTSRRNVPCSAPMLRWRGLGCLATPHRRRTRRGFRYRRQSASQDREGQQDFGNLVSGTET